MKLLERIFELKVDGDKNRIYQMWYFLFRFLVFKKSVKQFHTQKFVHLSGLKIILACNGFTRLSRKHCSVIFTFFSQRTVTTNEAETSTGTCKL